MAKRAMRRWTAALAVLAGSALLAPAAAAAGGTVADAAARLTYGPGHWDGSPEADLSGGLSDPSQDVTLESGWWLRVPFYGDDREYALSPPGFEYYSGNRAVLVSLHHGLWILEQAIVEDSGSFAPRATHVSRVLLRNDLQISTPVFLYNAYTPALVLGANQQASVGLAPGYLQITSFQQNLGVASVVYRAPGAQHFGCTNVGRLATRLNDGDDDYFSDLAPDVVYGTGRPVDCGAQWSFWLAPGETRTFYAVVSTATWPRFAKGDLDFDNQPDLYFRELLGNGARAWTMRDNAAHEDLALGPFPRPLVGVDDFNGDFENDFVLRDAGTGQLFIVPSVGGTPGAAVPVGNPEPLGPQWRLVGTGTYGPASSTPDLVLQNDATGELRIWLMSGTTRTGTLIPTPAGAPDPGWRAVAVNAFATPGGARCDLLFQNQTSGRLVLWYMGTDGVRLSSQFTNPPAIGNLNWHVVAAGDYGVGTGGTYLGTTDIVWRNSTSGRLVVWRMAYGSRIDGVFMNPDGAAWAAYDVVAPR